MVLTHINFIKGPLMTQDNIPLFPVAQLTVGPVPRLGIIVIRPDFLTTLMDQPKDAQTGRTYALTPVQARYLAEQIQQALATLENAAPPDGAGPTH